MDLALLCAIAGAAVLFAGLGLYIIFTALGKLEREHEH
jgi:hypothetical protein